MNNSQAQKYHEQQVEEANEEEKKKLERAKAKELRMLQLLEDVKTGTGYSTDLVLSRYFSVPRQRIWVWSRQGKLPQPYKIGDNTTRWKNEEVKEAEVKNFLGGLYGK